MKILLVLMFESADCANWSLTTWLKVAAFVIALSISPVFLLEYLLVYAILEYFGIFKLLGL